MQSSLEFLGSCRLSSGMERHLTCPRGRSFSPARRAYPNQAFRWKEKAYGVQFHLEISAEMAEQWSQVPDYAAALERSLGAGAASKVVGDVLRVKETLHSHARRMFENWLKACEIV